ncbi:MAG: hypothetical protein Q7U20_03790 [Caulobacter sp.]|nr:hypothetical protein [Caulobacter sp.]
MSRLDNREMASVWWAFFWRTVVGGLVAGAVGGGLAGLVMAIVGYGQYGSLAGAVVGWIANLVVSFFALRMAIEKKYGTFALKVSRPGEDLSKS